MTDQYDAAECFRDEVKRFMRENTFNALQVTNFYVQGNVLLSEFDELKARFAASQSEVVRLTKELTEAREEEEATYQIGLRDGYEKGIQDVDELTGGDGRYFVSTIPGEGCPDPDAMKEKIVARFEALGAGNGSDD